ncbi:MAG: response regulator [Mucilaginibacter sp.]|jgi:CheY-like chemotaxis protein|nr:response regulator [Mucilaginibacter sp.]
MSILFVLDDDPVFHRLIELSLARSRPFKSVYHHYEAKPLINYLWANRDDRSNLPDIIFVDIKMPVIDGWDFMDALQKIFPTLCKKITVYVVSVSVIKSDMTRAAKYPFVREFISKPISTGKLMDIAQQMSNANA